MPASVLRIIWQVARLRVAGSGYGLLRCLILSCRLVLENLENRALALVSFGVG